MRSLHARAPDTSTLSLLDLRPISTSLHNTPGVDLGKVNRQFLNFNDYIDSQLLQHYRQQNDTPSSTTVSAKTKAGKKDAMEDADEELSMQDRILSHIKGWRAPNTVKPPFSEEELIAMALTMSAADGVDILLASEISYWICDTFNYYKYIAFASLHQSVWDSEALRFRNRLTDALTLWDAPWLSCPKSEADGSAHYHSTSATTAMVQYSVLGKRSEDEATFPFFDLPPEIRNRIYDAVFRFPKSGLCFDKGSEKSGARVLSRDLNNMDVNWRDRARQFRTQPISKILAPLATSKQFRQEALPYFYHVNTFIFPDQSDMNATLRRLPKAHIPFLCSIRFTYLAGGACKHAFSILSKMTGLKQLTMVATEDSAEFLIECELIAMQFLERLRGLEKVEFVGCESLGNVLGDLWTVPRLVKQRKGKRDYAVDDGDAGGEEVRDDAIEEKNAGGGENAGDQEDAGEEGDTGDEEDARGGEDASGEEDGGDEEDARGGEDASGEEDGGDESDAGGKEVREADD
ncbi:hypothetical protein LTR86_001179 [Recurvomyces mirabilis]|nr:hypothetical protein LTR86_001179 [Recurvomyces mirabilis]